MGLFGLGRVVLRITMKRRAKVPIFLLGFPLTLIADSPPSADDFFNALYSQALFLEQCVANQKIESTDIHNANIRAAEALGFSITDYWPAAQKGSKGEVFDMLKDDWTIGKFDIKNCRFVRQEQLKFNKTLSKY